MEISQTEYAAVRTRMIASRHMPQSMRGSGQWGRRRSRNGRVRRLGTARWTFDGLRSFQHGHPPRHYTRQSRNAPYVCNGPGEVGVARGRKAHSRLRTSANSRRAGLELPCAAERLRRPRPLGSRWPDGGHDSERLREPLPLPQESRHCLPRRPLPFLPLTLT